MHRRPGAPLVRFLIATAVALGLAVPGAPARAVTVPLPDTMAAVGDSITRGYVACGFYLDCPSRSWSTGTNAGVASHYTRLLARTDAIRARNYNVAKRGAKMSDASRQVGLAVARGADYVTVLLGANDACTATAAAMTPVATFESQFAAAMGALKAGRPEALVLVSSIPDLKRLWSVGKGSAAARLAWSVFGICQSMLAKPRSTAAADAARRDRVRQRVMDYNAALAAVCTAYGPNCRYDAGAVFSYPFALSQLSPWDYFHPSSSGQAVLAEVTWAASFDW